MFLADVVFHNDRFPLNVFLLWNRYPKCVTCDTFQYLSSPYFEITVFLLAALLERTSSMTPPREPTRSDASDSAPFPFGNKSKELIGTIVLLDTSKINGMQDNSSDGCCHMLAVWVNREARGRQLGESGGPRKTIVIGNGGKKGVQCQLLEAAFLTFLIADWNLKKILFSWSKDSIHDVTGSLVFFMDRKSRVSDEKLLHVVVPPNYCRKIKGAMQYDLGDDSTPVWQSGEFFFFGSSPIKI